MTQKKTRRTGFINPLEGLESIMRQAKNRTKMICIQWVQY